MADNQIPKLVELANASATDHKDLYPEVRNTAVSALASHGFPTIKTEGWRKTPLKDILSADYVLAQTGGKHTERQWWRDGLEGCRMITLANGRLNKGCSQLDNLPDGLEIVELSASGLNGEFNSLADSETNPFTAVNTAAFADALVVRIAQGAVIDEPIHLYHQTHSEGEPVLANQRVLVIAEANSSATIIESFTGANGNPYLLTAVSEFIVAENAGINHVRLQDEGPAGSHMGSTWLKLDAYGRFTSHALNFGGKTSRHDIHAEMVGQGAECTFNGLYLGDDEQLLDTHSVIHHAVPHCDSHQLYRGILDDNATGVFNGMIHVHPQAQKTDAKQNSSAILLSEAAHIFAEPQLEIYADDVKCAHGSTIGQLDEEQLFYLKTRGIDSEVAKSLLLVAFAAESFRKLPVKALYEAVDQMLMDAYSRA